MSSPILIKNVADDAAKCEDMNPIYESSFIQRPDVVVSNDVYSTVVKSGKKQHVAVEPEKYPEPDNDQASDIYATIDDVFV
jgi:hypothetical protein